MFELDTLFQTKTAKKKQTLWRGTYLYSLYKGLSPRGEKLFADYEQARLINRQGRSSGLIPCTERRLNRFKRRCLKQYKFFLFLSFHLAYIIYQNIQTH